MWIDDKQKANKFWKGIILLFIILYHPPNLPASQAPEAVTILHPHLGILGLGWFWSRRRVRLSLLSLLRLYLNLLSISQIGHQWSDWSPRWITSFSRFFHLSSQQSRLVGLSRLSLDFPPRLRIIKRDWLPIEDQWKETDVGVLRVGSLTASSHPSSFCFTHGSFNDKGWLLLHHQSGKALALLWADTQAKSLTRLS